MLFNSIQFAVFLPVVFLLYWFVVNKKRECQNILLLTASYFFYACWDWRFMFLLIFSTLLDYFTGLKMSDATEQNKKRFWFRINFCSSINFNSTASSSLYKNFNFHTRKRINKH